MRLGADSSASDIWLKFGDMSSVPVQIEDSTLAYDYYARRNSLMARLIMRRPSRNADGLKGARGRITDITPNLVEICKGPLNGNSYLRLPTLGKGFEILSTYANRNQSAS